MRFSIMNTELQTSLRFRESTERSHPVQNMPRDQLGFSISFAVTGQRSWCSSIRRCSTKYCVSDSVSRTNQPTGLIRPWNHTLVRGSLHFLSPGHRVTRPMLNRRCENWQLYAGENQLLNKGTPSTDARNLPRDCAVLE